MKQPPQVLGVKIVGGLKEVAAGLMPYFPVTGSRVFTDAVGLLAVVNFYRG